MRGILIDWLVEVHMKFRLASSTLYHCVWLIDRYCSTEQVMRAQLQLVGVTAMFIASKYEEIYAPECRDFVYISDKAYTREQILSMEGQMHIWRMMCVQAGVGDLPFPGAEGPWS
mgnify:CR=1 FL=1